MIEYFIDYRLVYVNVVIVGNIIACYLVKLFLRENFVIIFILGLLIFYWFIRGKVFRYDIFFMYKRFSLLFLLGINMLNM